MIKKTITYTDYNGVERTEDHYFNLTKTELVRMELGKTGGLSDYMTGLINAQDVPALMNIFEQFVQKAYGKKSEDGRRFMKSPEITASFVETEAYDQLFWDLFNNAGEAAAFFNAIIPAELAEKVEEMSKKQDILPIPNN